MRTLVLVLLLFGSVALSSQSQEWHQWRGPNRDGVSAETGLLAEWPAAGPPPAWQATGAGEGYSSFSSTRGRLFTMGAREPDELVILAYDVRRKD